jgi:tetratricopeptide (TPR) repeat protein
MSRFGDYDYDEYYPNQAELWRANAERALKGKRGRKALAELREALRALPDKRLIEGALCTVGEARLATAAYSRDDLVEKVQRDGEGVCAVGAYVWFKKVKAGMDPQEAFEQLPTLLDVDSGDYETALAGQRAGMTYVLASTLAYRNDQTYEGMTPERRYEAFMEWLDDQLAEVMV